MVSRNGKKTSRSPSAKRSASRQSSAQKKGWPRWLVWLLRLMLVGLVLTLVGLVYLDAQVRAKFDGNKWTLPAKVFARPLSVYPGLLLSPEQLKAELE